jgi:hypothetical protein
MKKFTLLFTAICFSLFIYAENDYHKFSVKGALWNTLTTGRISYPYEWQTIYTLGDTVELNDTKYLGVIKELDWYRGTVGGLREDTLTKKVYYYNYNFEDILYDFSLDGGDTIHYGKGIENGAYVYFKVVDSIKTITLTDEVPRKVWYLTNSMYTTNDIWIEGIGSVVMFGPLNPLMPVSPTDYSSTYFGCYKSGNVLYFNREATDSENCPCSRWLVSVPEVKNNISDVHLYPIPAKDKLNIGLGNSNYDFIEIYSVNSKLLEKIAINSRNNIEIMLDNLKAGMYFIKFSGKTNNHLMRFIKI